MNAEHEFLASAYLDGDLTDEERRIAEADPAVMAEVAELRALRDELASPPPPSDEARESAISAAMAAFGQLYGADTPATAPAPVRVVPFRPRPAISRWLSAAAAVLVVGLLGVVVVAGLRSGGDDDDAAPADEPASEEAAFEAAAEEPADDDGNERMTEGASSDADDAEALLSGDEAAADMADEPASDEMAEEEAADEPADAPAGGADDDTADEPASEEPAEAAIDPAAFLDDGVPIETSEQLAAVAQLLLERQAEDGLTTPEESCPFPNMLARAELLDSLTGEIWPIVIDVDVDNNLVLAIDVDSCEVRLDAALTQAP